MHAVTLTYANVDGSGKWVADGPVHVLPDGWPQTAADVRSLERHISGAKRRAFRCYYRPP
jgi:hypothetical protein